ncbi:hypothetical protein [Taibaiella chishuiensis]|uniref:Uncharacterized protein n=1 Tax=Taibaiella chishuiensis TaxID=1434707 RepID=A0A2P8DBM8_9BACT|nr:hypothetical protein [Taibaiella chishuiensis]PSK94619.1 hypothetical protein B0I18_101778 [Taibaiella chishuiensis]
MQSVKPVPEQQIRLPDSAIAQLLGLSLGEYHKLSHRPMEDFKDIEGRVIAFFMHISPNNDKDILAKLKLDHSNFVRFKAEEVFSYYR